jgi:hypothetical protein
LARLPTYYAINFIVLAPVLLVELAIPLLQTGGVGPRNPNAGIIAGGRLFAFVLMLILQPIATAAILHIIAQEFIDQRASMGDALRFALSRFGALFVASFLAGLIIWLGLILCLVPGILFAIWYVFVGQVVVVEGLRGDRALARSKELTQGYRGRVFGMAVLFFIIAMLLGAGAFVLERLLPGNEMVITQAGLRQSPNLRNEVIQIVLSTALNFLVQTYSAICFTLFYFDLRIRKEGFDLELAAKQQAAPAVS